ncbi:hypothetical protein IFR05_010944 [Cadophora sp. M221]|nr:hypothetical protein IFR05_010944 [Cadophora sp. M221]
MTSKAQRRRFKQAQSSKCKTQSSNNGVRPGPGSGSGFIPPPIHPGNGKRKRETSISETSRKVYIKRIEDFATSQSHSLETASRVPHSIPPDSSANKRRLPKPLGSRQKSSRSNSSEECELCLNRPERRTWKNKLAGAKIAWVQCQIKACELWYHLSCLFLLLHQEKPREPQSMVFYPASSLEIIKFVCPKCADQQRKGCDKAVREATRKAFLDTFEVTKKQDIEEISSTEGSTHILAALDDIEFEPAREERYSDFDDSLVNSLVRNLQQAIFDYDIEIESTIDRYGAISDSPSQTPLATWELVDAHSSAALGQHWFEVGGKRATHHEPITAALRSILGIPSGDSLRIATNLEHLTRSQDMYALPNMKSMRAMMAGVASAGEARWPGQGVRLLQEVQLRTWYKSDFQQTLLSNVESFEITMAAFLQPLTKFEGNKSLSNARRNIIEITLRLWSYLQSLRGKVVLIQPAIEDVFDPKLHKPYDQEGSQLDMRKSRDKKILWVLCRGFRYEEDDEMDSIRTLTVKAHVVVD